MNDPPKEPSVHHRSVIVLGGLSFVVAALAFVLVFSYLAANFDYPDILDGTPAEVLPRLRAGGSTMRAVWAIYAFLPLLLVPGAVGAYLACPSSRGRMTLALVAASLGAFAMCLGPSAGRASTGPWPVPMPRRALEPRAVSARCSLA